MADCLQNGDPILFRCCYLCNPTSAWNILNSWLSQHREGPGTFLPVIPCKLFGDCSGIYGHLCAPEHPRMDWESVHSEEPWAWGFPLALPCHCLTTSLSLRFCNKRDKGQGADGPVSSSRRALARTGDSGATPDILCSPGRREKLGCRPPRWGSRQSFFLFSLQPPV